MMIEVKKNEHPIPHINIKLSEQQASSLEYALSLVRLNGALEGEVQDFLYALQKAIGGILDE